MPFNGAMGAIYLVMTLGAVIFGWWIIAILLFFMGWFCLRMELASRK